MIHTVTVNPALDITYRVEEIVFDDTVRAEDVLRAPGGKGINVSRVAARLGQPTVAMGFVGGRAGEELRERLEAEDVRTWFTHVAGATRTNAIVQDGAGHQIRVSGPGAEVTPDDVDRLVESLFDLRAPDMLALCGSLVPAMPPDFYTTVARRAEADGIRVAIDADGRQLESALEAGVYLVKPNRYELERLTGRQVGTREDAVAASRPLLKQGIQVVLTSLGAQGAVLVSSDCALHAYAPHVEIDSAVGAGDAMLAGALSAAVDGAPWETLLRLGVACGTATAMTPGTELCRSADIEALLPQIVVETL
ncbi:MAG TPA: 1-phosphofructokinase [Trueperaceae bacterium]|nr:1-phosphofructokinase [Trueperaceae bacterium]